ncbi:MAG: hypothetical protein LBE57_02685 [Methanosarcinales archaeon]|jgi:hypothetical protein|nr:hypothetical protein [Methanosarcinales archaeon]
MHTEAELAPNEFFLATVFCIELLPALLRLHCCVHLLSFITSVRFANVATGYLQFALPPSRASRSAFH